MGWYFAVTDGKRGKEIDSTPSHAQPDSGVAAYFTRRSTGRCIRWYQYTSIPKKRSSVLVVDSYSRVQSKLEARSRLALVSRIHYLRE